MRIGAIRDDIRQAIQAIPLEEKLEVMYLTGMFTCQASGLSYPSFELRPIPLAIFYDEILESGDDELLADAVHEAFYPHSGDYKPSRRFDPDVLREMAINMLSVLSPEPIPPSA